MLLKDNKSFKLIVYIKNMDEQKRVKMAIIAGAAHAIRFKEKNWRASEQEVIKQVSDNIDEILINIDKEI